VTSILNVGQHLARQQSGRPTKVAVHFGAEQLTSLPSDASSDAVANGMRNRGVQARESRRRAHEQSARVSDRVLSGRPDSVLYLCRLSPQSTVSSSSFFMQHRCQRYRLPMTNVGSPSRRVPAEPGLHAWLVVAVVGAQAPPGAESWARPAAHRRQCRRYRGRVSRRGLVQCTLGIYRSAKGRGTHAIDGDFQGSRPRRPAGLHHRRPMMTVFPVCSTGTR